MRRHLLIPAIGAVLLTSLGQAAPQGPSGRATQPAAPEPAGPDAPARTRSFTEAGALIAFHRLIGGERGFRALAGATLLDPGPASVERRFAVDRARRRLGG